MRTPAKVDQKNVTLDWVYDDFFDRVYNDDGKEILGKIGEDIVSVKYDGSHILKILYLTQEDWAGIDKKLEDLLLPMNDDPNCEVEVEIHERRYCDERIYSAIVEFYYKPQN